MDVQTAEVMVAAPRLERFRPAKTVVCPKCNEGVSRLERLISVLRGGWACCADVKFCAGGKEPVERLSPLQQMTTGRSEVHMPCAGVMGEHLHVTCKFCSHTFLMETAR